MNKKKITPYYDLMVSLGFLVIFVVMAILGIIYLDYNFLIGFISGGAVLLLLFISIFSLNNLKGKE
ncbi:hypothetical protein LCGC14_2279790 [marine sediment metagenome]|uniref:Uncharacterized protein n=1 Tax=marine sediment metagenome TaxID=412755 RepID=A0A0F9CUD2_9ZZZZ